MNPAAPHIEPWNLDYTDAFNPFLLNQFSAAIRPDDHAMIQSPLWTALRLATGYETFLRVVPDGQHIAVAARGNYEERFYVPHGSFLYALTAASTEAAGFKAQIADLANGGTLFNTPTHHALIAPAGAAAIQGMSNRIHYLQHPRAIISPGLLAVQIINLAAAANSLQLVLWFFQPEQFPARQAVPNEYNAYLQNEIESQTRTRRNPAPAFTGGTSELTGPSAIAPAAEPLMEAGMPIGSFPLRRTAQVFAPAAGTSDFEVLEFTVPAGYSCAINKIRHNYLGPAVWQGTGDMIFRLSVDNAHSPGFDDMRTAAEPAEELSGSIIARSGQTIRYTVSLAAAAVLPDEVVCGVWGYFYPQE